MKYDIARTVEEARRLLPPESPAVVVVPVYNAYDDVVRCYEALFAHTPEDVPVLVVDDAGQDRRVVSVLDVAADSGRKVVVLQQAENRGFVLGMNDAFAAAGRADVVLVNSDVAVGPEWYERMHAAACSSSTVGTASPFTNHGTILSLPDRNVSRPSLPQGLTLEQAARRVALGSPQLRPRIPTAIGHCTWFRRSMLDVVGFFDPAFSPGYSEEVDLSQRAVAAGFQHVAADDVFVYHRGGSSFGRSEQVLRLQQDHDRMIKSRYPYYFPWVVRAESDEASPLAASLAAARVALVGMRVGVDAMCVGPTTMGTQITVLETIRALAEREDVVETHVFIPHACPGRTRELLSALPGVTLHPTGALVVQERHKVDVVYRPYQVTQPGELEWLRTVGERVVINQLDMIAFHNPAYFPNDDRWPRYRDLARLAGVVADGLAFISHHSEAEARREGIVGDGTAARVVYNGTAHSLSLTDLAAQPVPGRQPKPGFLLCIGASYLHKNRPFTIELWRKLRERGWDGELVLVGPTPPEGSSQAREAEMLLQHPELADGVLRLGAVSDGQKTWLMENAGLVLYPTVSEGFGLVPFEAGLFGVPALSTRQGSLDEVLPREVLALESWDVDAAADLALTLLQDDEAITRQCAALRTRAAEFTWDRTAELLHSLFVEVIGRPGNRAQALRGEAPGAAGRSRRRPPPQLHRGFAWAVRQVVDRPDVKQALSPPGSRRERAGRAIIRSVGSRL
jgi:GT2 family glycosyltransferase/glycosyltransferase involved in cell wall biosynthesis